MSVGEFKVDQVAEEDEQSALGLDSLSPPQVPQTDDVKVDQAETEKKEQPTGSEREWEAAVEEQEGASIREVLKEAMKKVDDLIQEVDPAMKGRREQRIQSLPGTVIEQFDRTYVQLPLSFHGELRLNKLIGDLLQKIRGEGDLALDLTDLLNVDNLVRSVLSVFTEFPDFADEFYFLVLNVPRDEQPFVKDIFQQSHDYESGRGGLSVEDATEIIDVFVAQNGKVLSDFLHSAKGEGISRKVVRAIASAFSRLREADQSRR